MKTVTFRNKLNGEHFVCDDLKAVETIDGIEFLIVRREGKPRPYKIRKDMLEKIQFNARQK